LDPAIFNVYMSYLFPYSFLISYVFHHVCAFICMLEDLNAWPILFKVDMVDLRKILSRNLDFHLISIILRITLPNDLNKH
jgi:hypothetical protein